MRLILLAVMLFMTATAIAQTDTSYQLLWYAGKKIKPNVLLTPKGDTVLYDPAKGTIKMVSKTGSGKQFDNMLAELNKTPQRLKQTINRLSGLPETVRFSYTAAATSAYNGVKDRYDDMLSNVIQLPVFKTPSLVTGKGGFFYPDAAEYPWEEIIKEFRKYYADHQYDNLKDIKELPVYDFSYCYPCDKEKNEAYENSVDRYETDMVGRDKEMIEKALVMARQAHTVLAPGPEQKRVLKECNMMIDYVMGRMELRSLALIDKYIDDPYRTAAVLRIVLPTHRTKLLMGGEGEDLLPSDYRERSVKSVMKVLRKALEEKDYPVALNMQFWLATERQIQLMGVQDSGDLLRDMIAFNQFKLNMNVSAKVSGGGGYILGQIKGDNWFAAIPDENCKLVWHLRGPLEKKTKAQLLAAEFRGAGVEVEYVGTKTWLNDIPTFRLDFCNDIPDTITVYPFHPEDFQELWRFPAPLGVQNAAEMNSVMLGCFIDIKRTREEASRYKDPANVEKMKKEMAAQYEQIAKQYASGTMPVNGGLDAMQNASRQMTELVHKSNPGRYIFQPEVRNKEKEIIKDKINGKELFPENAATEYAWFHLTLEHDPTGPYVMSLYK